MAAKIADLAQHFIGQAKENPAQKYDICRQAAYTFLGLALEPANGRLADHLTQMGHTFARAANNARPPVVEDFAELLNQTAQAYQEVIPFGKNETDLIARRREINESRTPHTPGQVYITPESFNVDVTLGRSQKIKWNPTDEDKVNQILQSSTVAFWQGVKKEAQAMTVDVSLGFTPAIQQQTDVPFAMLNNRAFAEVEFGSDGNRNKIVLDLGRGQRLTVVGNYVSVNVGMDMPRAGFSSQVLDAGASIGAFAAPSRAPVMRTLYVDDLPTGGSSPWTPIPLKGSVLLPFMNPLHAGNVEISFADAGGNIIGQYLITLGANVIPPTIPIPGEAAYISVGNFTGITTSICLPFELSL